MTETAQFDAIARLRRPIRTGLDPFAAFGVLALAFGVALRLSQRENLPLWLDETITAAIASEPSLGAVLRQSLLDVNAPAYFVIAHLWSSLTSFSNEALRAPALAFGLAAPFLCLAGAPGLSARARWMWVALVALWLPAIIYSNEARGYSLLYALAVANTVAFIRFLAQRTQTSALLWAATVSALLLTHYIALFLAVAQGLLLLAVLGRRAFGFWPAILPLAPALAFMAVHSARVLEFADPQYSWYALVDAATVPRIYIWTMGGLELAMAMAVCAVILVAGRLYRDRQATSGPMSGRAPWLAALAGAAGWAIFIAFCMIRPNFTPRYLIVFIPAVMLGVAAVAERAGSVVRIAPALVLLLAFFQTLEYRNTDRRQYNVFEFQSGARFLMDAGARSVTFFWDNPNNETAAPEQMKLVGEFFFKRAGRQIEVTSARTPFGSDPNLTLVERAADVGAGFIWLYDREVRRTAALKFPPRLDEALSDFHCHSHSNARVVALACIRTARGGTNAGNS